MWRAPDDDKERHGSETCKGLRAAGEAAQRGLGVALRRARPALRQLAVVGAGPALDTRALLLCSSDDDTAKREWHKHGEEDAARTSHGAHPQLRYRDRGAAQRDQAELRVVGAGADSIGKLLCPSVRELSCPWRWCTSCRGKVLIMDAGRDDGQSHGHIVVTATGTQAVARARDAEVNHEKCQDGHNHEWRHLGQLQSFGGYVWSR